MGGSGRPAEVRELVAEVLALPSEVLDEELTSGSSRFENQVAWARFYLAKAGYIDSSKRGVWALTEKGLAAGVMGHDQALHLYKTIHGGFAGKPTGPAVDSGESDAFAPEEAETAETLRANWRQTLIELVQSLPSDGFERLCQRLLREAGFEQVTVTGRSGDGGLDGVGMLQVNPFVSFRVLFQCKRYSGSVSPSQVRDFRGAMQGRADKGIILTTGTFTSEARKEAIRDGVPAIELVDRDKLIEMFERLELGLRQRIAFEVDTSFFDQFLL
ncbi:MAG: restriction endonuclease [Actinomycetota bacterium]|nr:restriction endonuclease [Actinomycetota bacterium]